MIDWRARFPEPNPDWGPDLLDDLERLYRAERTLAATPEHTVDKFKRQKRLRAEIHAANAAAAQTAGDYVALRLNALDFERRAALRGLGFADIERSLPRKLSWRAAPDLVARLVAMVR